MCTSEYHSTSRSEGNRPDPRTAPELAEMQTRQMIVTCSTESLFEMLSSSSSLHPHPSTSPYLLRISLLLVADTDSR